jgi:Alpha/beta hydrolase domain
MKYSKTIAATAASLALLTQPLAAANETAATSGAQSTLPKVSGPIPVTRESRPFLGAQAAIESAGYVEDEYLLSGEANTYDWKGSGHAVKVIAGPGKYVTRILVMRPRDAARFGGNVEVTVLNASLNLDFGGPADFAAMVKQGDVWIGITTKAVTANALKKFDPDRYAPLDWSNPAPPASRCADPTMIPTYMAGGREALAAMAKAGVRSSWPEYEDGLVWDMLGQLGLLLKSDQRSAILPGFSKPWVYMTGVSQSSIYIRTWIAGFHDRYRTPDGKPVYDGYLGIVGPAMIRINQCAADMALEDPLQKLAPPDVPFISISSEGEMWQARYTHQRDAFTRRGGFVTYEVAGASHRAGDVPGLKPDRISFAPIPDMIKAGMQIPSVAGAPNLIPAGAVPNDFIWQPLVRGAFHNLELWARRGIRPPRAPGIALDAKLEIRRDGNGNALGGLRMPYIEAPVATYTGYLTAGGFGGVTGAKKHFAPEALRALYPDSAAYVAKFNAATDRLLAGRWISAEDAAAMKAAAAASPSAPPKPQ